jgi:replication-associated recombination protein RarA
VAALHTIKKFQHNDMITFFGVSGCGKTRAVVEMLAQNWGFYLNGSQADRGSKDVTTLFESAQKMPTR